MTQWFITKPAKYRNLTIRLLDSCACPPHRHPAPTSATIRPSDPRTVKFLEARVTTPKCLTNDDLATLRQAFERYGTGDGFWMNYQDVLDAAILRDGCDWETVHDEMRTAYKKWAGEDAEFL